MKNIYPFIILILLFLTFGCSAEAAETEAPQETATVTSTGDLPGAQVEIITQTPVPTATGTPAPTATSPSHSPTATQTSVPTVDKTKIPPLAYCQETESEICVGSFLPQSNKLGMVFLKPDNQEAAYILFDEQRYDCIAVTGFSDRYFCSGLPALYNQPVLIQIFIERSAVPLAEGYMIIQPPPDKPTPPDPYTP